MSRRGMWLCPCCLRYSFTPEEVEQRYKSLEIDKMLEKDKQARKRQVRLLLLGTGESGKSTFLKQMRIIHGITFESELVMEYQSTIYQNVIKGMRVLVDARNKLGIPWEDCSKDEYGQELIRFNPSVVDTRVFLKYSPLVAKLWQDGGIRRTFERRREFQLSDSVEYFFNNLDRLARLDYIPNNKDILYCRKATKGITEFTIPINNIPFVFVDVGGQRSQRRKWYQCFCDSVTAMLFLVSSSEYDQKCVEDLKRNRLEESREVFDAIVNHRDFANVPVILFFNKFDLLKKKVLGGQPHHQESDIRRDFPEFIGNPRNVNDVKSFILTMITSAKKDPKKILYHHFTTAVDTENIKIVFDSVKDYILHRNLESLMLQ